MRHASSPAPSTLIVLMCLLGFGCDAPTSPQGAAPEPLIENGTFEQHGKPTLAVWRFGNGDLASSVQAAAPGHGEWSLRLDADWAPTMGFAYVSVPDARPGDRLRLSAFVRALAPDGGGVIQIVQGRSLSAGRMYAKGTTDLAWTRLSVEAVVSDEPADSVWVVLSSLHTEVTARSGLFDGVELTRLAPSTLAATRAR